VDQFDMVNKVEPMSQVQSSNVRPLPSKANWYARRMADEVQAQKRKLVGNAALRQRPYMAGNPVLPAEHVMKK